MRRGRRNSLVVALAGAGTLGFFAAEAPGVDLPTTTTVTVPTTVPQVTVPNPPIPPIPQVSAPQPKAPVNKPTVPSATPSAPSARGGPSPQQGSASTSSSPSSSPSSSGGNTSSGHSSHRNTYSQPQSERRSARVSRAHAKRRWIARGGSPGQRSTVIVFRLSRPAIVYLTIVQVSPTCRRWGRLRVRGHAGVNHIPFRGRVRGRSLPAGTYRIRARAGGSRRVAVLRLVIADRRPHELRSALAASACARGGSGSEGANASAGSGGDSRLSVEREVSAGGQATPGGQVEQGGVLGAQAVVAAPVGGTRDGLRLGLLLALALAAGLLALVALPSRVIPHARTASLVVDRRLELALAAGSLMVVGAAAYMLAA